jgi:biotin carboxylase
VAAAREVGLPCVLKPTVLSASQGVIRADDDAGVRAAFSRLRAILSRPEVLERTGLSSPQEAELLCESFVPGAEVALEGLLTDGKLTVLALFDKPDPLDGPFFEETLYVTPSRLPEAVQEAIARTTAAAVAALRLRDGPIHAELRLPRPLEPVVIEVAARSIGGLCSRTLRFCTGRSLDELILLSALGRSPPPAELRRESAAAGVMMLPIPQAGVLQQWSGLDEAAAVPGIESVQVTARLLDELLPVPEGRAYLGFIFARAATPAQVETALRAAHRCLHFTIAKVLPTT